MVAPSPQSEGDDDIALEQSFLTYLEESASLDGGLLTVGYSSFSAGLILRELDPEGYRSAMLAFNEEKRERLISTIEQFYPTPVSLPVYLAANYADSNVQRLAFLKDAWESVIRFVHAVCISEIRASGIVIQGRHLLSLSNIMSDSIYRLVENIGQMRTIASEVDNLMWISAIEEGVIDQMKALNRTRNTISHSPSATEIEAGAIYSSVESGFWSLIEGLPALRDVQLIRPSALIGTQLKTEVFRGHSGLPRRVPVELNPSSVMTSYSLVPPPFDPKHLLVSLGSEHVCVAPFIHFVESSDGRSLKMCLLRQQRKVEEEEFLVFDVVGEASEHTLPRREFDDHLRDIRRVFGLPLADVQCQQ